MFRLLLIDMNKWNYLVDNFIFRALELSLNTVVINIAFFLYF